MSDKPLTVEELEGDGLALNGERYLGMPVIAYQETVEIEGVGPTSRFSTHWSTPTTPNVRLFSEHDVLKMIKEIINDAE